MSRKKNHKAQNRRDRRKAKASGWRRQGTTNARKKRHHVYENPWTLEVRSGLEIRDDAGSYEPKRIKTPGYIPHVFSQLSANYEEPRMASQATITVDVKNMKETKDVIELLRDKIDVLEKRASGFQSSASKLKTKCGDLTSKVSALRQHRNEMQRERDLLKHLLLEIYKGGRCAS